MARYDLAVLGGGTAGLVAAVGASRLGARVVLVERARTGGDCLWTGCVPSKSLLAAANLAQRMRTAGSVGLEPVEPRLDFAAVMAHVRGAQARIAPHDSVARLEREGVEVLAEHGRFTGPGRLAAGGRELRFRRALVATGSEPRLPPVPGLDLQTPLTTDTVWDLDALPGRLVVLGGGPSGCELAQAFARLGSRVTLVESAEEVLPREEPEARALVAAALRDDGVDVRTGTHAVRAQDGALVVSEPAGDEARVAFDRVLVATGRRPRTEGIGLAALGARTTGDGAVEVDATMRTTAPGVFAAGDVTGLLPFTHAAAHQAAAVVPNALFHARRRVDPAAVPWVTFTSPPVARAGLSEAQARARHGAAVSVRRHDYGEVDRAVTEGDARGFAKLVLGRRGRLLGATVAAPAGDEAIAALAAMVAGKATVARLAGRVHPYPTLGEGPARAAQEHLSATWLTERTRRLTRPLLALLRAAEAVR